MHATYMPRQSNQLSRSTASLWPLEHHCVLDAAIASRLLSPHHAAFFNYFFI